MRVERPALLALSLLFVTASRAVAGGPLAMYDEATRTPYAYTANVNVYTDLGGNGPLTQAQSDTLTARAFAQWTGVVSAAFSGSIAGKILVGGVPTNIVLANADSIIGKFNGGGIHVIYDTDGSIISGFFGAPPGVAGVASPEYADEGSPTLIESWAVFNGASMDPGDTTPYPGASFGGVYTHELGHAINLAHTQTNGAILFFADNLGASDCTPLTGSPDLAHTETMYPFIDPSSGSTGVYQATVDLLDDIAALSNLYPTGGWPGNQGTITGKIYMPDGTTEVSGVNVIARNLANPLVDANSVLSGDYTQGAVGPDGLFTLNGLTPGAQYVLYVDKIVDGGFSTTPTTVQFIEEYWNGAGESGNVDTDDACTYVAITPVAGTPTVANILLNVDPSALTLGDDDAVQVPLPFGFPFNGVNYTSVWVGSNGFVTFGSGDTNPGASKTALLVGAPRIAGMWTDLDPTAGGSISAKQVGSNFQIKFTGIQEWYFGTPNTFTITLRPDGTHRVQYGDAQVLFFNAVAGRSQGAGAADPGPTNLDTAPQPLGVGTSNKTVYEEFPGFFGHDLAYLTLEYAPCGVVTAVDDGGMVPTAAALFQSRPNPFRSATRIAFDLPAPGAVRLRVFDVQGRLVRTLVDAEVPAGRHDVPWDGSDAAGLPAGPGTYFYRLETPTFEETRKTIRSD
jgi:hypothetical protein